MTNILNTRLIYFFVSILIVTFLGFYKTYLIKFPTFEGFTNTHHIHGALALSWILMLIIQPILLRYKQLEWHRLVGKISYVLMPILLLSFFFVAKAGYMRNIKILPEANALAELTNGIPDIFYMGLLYALGIIHKKNTPLHLRFMASTGLMILGPGLGRFLIVFCGMPPQYAIAFIIVLSTGAGLVWLISDVFNKKSTFPMSIFVGTGVMATFINANAYSNWWQYFAKSVVSYLF
jgi:hypothetical protein